MYTIYTRNWTFFNRETSSTKSVYIHTYAQGSFTSYNILQEKLKWDVLGITPFESDTEKEAFLLCKENLEQ